MEGKRKAPDKLSLVNIVTVGVVGSLLVWVSIIALQAYYKNTLDAEEQERVVEGQDVALRETRAEESAKISNYTTRADALRKKNVVVIPVDRAMQLVVDELTQNPKALTAPDVGPQDLPTLEAYPPYKAVPPPSAPAPAAPAPAAPAPADGTAAPADGAATPAAPAPADGAATPAPAASGGSASKPNPTGDANP